MLRCRPGAPGAGAQAAARARCRRGGGARPGAANRRETSREIAGAAGGGAGGRWPIGERGGRGSRTGRGLAVRGRAAMAGNGGRPRRPPWFPLPGMTLPGGFLPLRGAETRRVAEVGLHRLQLGRPRRSVL